MSFVQHNQLTQEEVHTILLVMLSEVDMILRDNGIRYFLGFGSLLGAVRHQGFVPWDDDVDIHIFDEDFNKAMDALQTNLTERYVILRKGEDAFDWDVDSRIRDTGTRILDMPFGAEGAEGLFIDFFKVLKIKRSNRLTHVLLRKLQNKLSHKRSKILNVLLCVIKSVYNFCDILPSKRYFLVSDRLTGGLYNFNDLFPLREVDFEGLNLFVPANPDKILREIYGDYMCVPAVGERSAHFLKCVKKVKV